VTKPKKEIDLKSLARGYTNASIRAVAGLAENASDEGVKLAANKLLMERGWGRPQQEIKHTGTGEGGAIKIAIRHFTDGVKAPKK
jgi:hypothetical protein